MHWRTALATGALVALVLVPGTAVPENAASEASWLPLREGIAWAYRRNRDHSIEADGDTARTFFRGSLVQRVVEKTSPDGASPAIYKIGHVVREQALRGGSEAETREIDQLMSSDGRGVLLHGLELHWLEAGRQRRFPQDPPVRVLPPNPSPGQRWKVGTLRGPELTVTSAGEVVGIEDLELNGRTHRGCLHVRYVGTVEGERLTGSEAERTYRRDLWFERGVGIVKDVTEVRAGSLGPELEPLRFWDVTTLELERHSAAP